VNDIALIVPESPGTLTTAEMASAIAYAQNATAEATRRAYTSDWAAWRAFATSRGAQILPAHPGVVAAFLSAQADAGRKASSISRSMAAVAYHHKQAGYDPPPTATAGVRAVMRGIRRTIGTAPTKKRAATADVVMKMLAKCGDDLIGLRDRALIAVGMAGAFRRSELVALTTDDVEHVKDGLLITIRKSKGDQEGLGQVVSLPHGHHIRPVEALDAWLDAAGITGPGETLFRQVRLGGRLGGPLSGDAIARRVKVLVARAGLDRADFSAHSLRSGFLSSAAEHKADVFAMQRQSRHKSLDVLSGYVQSKNLFVGHAGSGFL
jgi:integrase